MSQNNGHGKRLDGKVAIITGATGGILEVPDMKAFQELLDSEEIRKAADADGLKMETLRVPGEFTP